MSHEGKDPTGMAEVVVDRTAKDDKVININEVDLPLHGQYDDIDGTLESRRGTLFSQNGIQM